MANHLSPNSCPDHEPGIYSPVSNNHSIGRDMLIVTGIDTDLRNTYEKIVTSRDA
ncbi:hypothetical protein LC608_23710 [Nostoc sp. XA010]|uniref:hypothetical protein n=1 Tax=Nostoc sp. XA010 TaxID=2780407 RepID=UPI001E37E3E1|nr:hypothetical protein [Nostoc sp. XA010]MCC5659928.1 hypothetical protein [Nostoc sp. XA010]